MLKVKPIKTMIEIENRSLKINNLLLVDLLVIFMKSNAATGYIQNPINIIRNDSIVLIKLPLTVKTKMAFALSF